MDVLTKKWEANKQRIDNINAQLAKHQTVPWDETEAAYYIGELQELKKSNEVIFHDILKEAPKDEAAHTTTFHKQEKEIMGMVMTAMRILTSVKKKPVQAQPQNPPQPDTRIRLPQIDLPTFEGHFQHWTSFSNLFEATVSDNQSLTDAVKLQYLKSAVKGEASKLISTYQITDANFQIAWDALEHRYANEREIVNAHLKTLLSQPALTKESASQLQQLIDTTTETIRALKVLKRPTQHWDDLLVYIIVDKLDSETRREWARTLKDKQPATFKQLTDFIEQHIRGLQASSSSSSSSSNRPTWYGGDRRQQAASHHAEIERCKICNGQHPLFKCDKFNSMQVQDRDHSVKDCRSQKTCKKCNKHHNTLLHLDRRPISSSASASKPSEVTKETTSLLSSRDRSAQVLLSTVLVKVADQQGQQHVCRALLDGGSEATFSTENCVKTLGIKRERDNTIISGISSTQSGTSRGRVSVQLGSCISNATVNSTALIIPKITGDQPRYTFKQSTWPHIEGLQLADPTFHVSGKIDLLIGADILATITKDGRIVGPEDTPTAFNSIFGWYLTGKVASEIVTSVRVHHTNCESDAILKRYWEIEELPPQKFLTVEEKRCEDHFMKTHRRDSSGRYVVQLPFRENIKNLGSSREQAISRLRQVEKRLERLPERRQQYAAFMKEFQDLGHMELVKKEELNNKAYFLPHHFVVKEDSTSTKLRVVFDGSAKSSTGLSLNDCMMVGPTIQDDLFALLLRFRWHPVAIKADIGKMYRQFAVDPQHRDFQRVLWRESSSSPIQEYRLTTVTYGTAPGSFLATRCLQQLAEDEKSKFPIASAVLNRDCYVDDLLSGAENPSQAIHLQKQLGELVKAGGMELRKWATSDKSVLESIPPELRETDSALDFDTDTTIKALGIKWKPSTDIFTFTVQPSTPSKVTKRIMLSELAKVFDPLGWLSPVTIRAKIMFQDLWRSNVGWDEELPIEIVRNWKSYQSELKFIKNIQIPRCVRLPNSTNQIHGFCDASLKAYVGTIYIRSESADGTIITRLLAAKTKVAPIKIVSLPKLELVGAVMMAKLITITVEALKFTGEVYAWTDSTLVLQWLAAHPGRWNTFVANRVAQVQDLIPTERWRHVISEENPADLATRGKSASELASLDLWWYGPAWLKNSTFPIYTATRNHDPSQLEERKVCVLTTRICIEPNLLSKYSSLTKLQRVTAYCLRFIKNCKSNKSQRITGQLSLSELQQALQHWIRNTQSTSFASEIKELEAKKEVPVSSKLSTLHPFLDSLGVLRVGGRLQKSSLPEDTKHQIILPAGHRFTELIIQHYHLVNLHANFQLLWATLNRKFWILRARDTIRHLVRKCVKCRRHRAEMSQQLMGSLPTARVTPGYPFQSCGVDYAGPFSTRLMTGRNNKTFKSYFAIFVCLATKAIHLEAVSELSTSAFIAAFKRFTGRRGVSSHMYSDCGSNFIGADKELKSLLESSQHNDTVTNYLALRGVTWHFNAPLSPHHGGLWEAGVKSVKFHLRRVIGDTRLTFEDFTTILIQVEACLNSRPLCAMSNDPNDFSVLTPGHFLIGQPLTAIPEPDLTDIKVNRLDKWQLVQQMFQHFWRRWSNEYLTTLQQRHKWKTSQENVQIGDVVVIRDDQLPPMKWPLGRIVDVQPGDDSLVRIATVKTQTGEYKRPIVKLCPILNADE